MTIASVAATLTQAATALPYRHFLRTLKSPPLEQARLLQWLMVSASRSEYGRHFGLRSTDPPEAFYDKIPIASYDDYRPWVERAVFQAASRVLSPHRIVRVEATSGTSSGVKWIPYTSPMMATFRRMFTLWAHDLLRYYYRARTGRLFLCVTGGRPNDGTLPQQFIGDDRDYLGKRWRLVLDKFVVAPQFARHEDPLEMLAQTLANEPQLEVMSFWSPSLLVSALDRLGVTTADEAKQLWPNLQLISCWTAASSSLFMPQLHKLFPQVTFQGKGLLATEAAMTIPLKPAQGCVPLLQDVYFEFIQSGDSTLRLDQLEEGGEYEVVVSNRAGLLRYRMGDRVRVNHFFHATPVLEFIGRAGIISDLVGEKLTLEFVERQLCPMIGSYFCLLPHESGYELWLNRDDSTTTHDFESLLCRNFHYARALKLGQLRPLEVHAVDGLAEQVRRAIEGDQATSATRAFKPPLMISSREKARAVSRALRRRVVANRE